MLDTLTSAPARIVAGALPVVPAADAATAGMHGVGQQITAYAGALLASALVHLGLKLIDYLKKKLSSSNEPQPNSSTDVTKA